MLAVGTADPLGRAADSATQTSARWSPSDRTDAVKAVVRVVAG
jgi:hypothetical protein